MWQGNWRDQVWEGLDRPFDLIIIGGGITGAGVLREAARLGLRTLLVDQKDFGWGTSSRSSKLVHGGLRYLQTFQIGLTRASVRERDRLIGEAPGLIDPLGFLIANYSGDAPGRWTFAAGLSVYDLLALHWTHRHFSAQDFQMLAPHLTASGLQGGFRYGDAQTDDARLVLRVLQEAVADGGTAINYVRAGRLLRDHDGSVVGVELNDVVGQRDKECRARVVINATGAWADALRRQVGGEPRLRPLRGSHLVFPAWRLPTAQAISFLHPVDRRPVFVFPWEGVTLVGTTDVDHCTDLDAEPSISPEEISYLMAAVCSQFAPLELGTEDIIATFAGIRPVIDTGKEDPSKESRDHIVWQESGLVTVTGGKLTTFRLIALDTLRAVLDLFPGAGSLGATRPVLESVDEGLLSSHDLSEGVRRRLLGRYGALAPNVAAAADDGEMESIPGTATLWCELRWAARAEGVMHLDDLLLRRVRLGLLLPEGGKDHLRRVRSICQDELGWPDSRWQTEVEEYIGLWHDYYRPLDPELVPDWRPALASSREARSTTGKPRRADRLIVAGCLCLLAVALWAWYCRVVSRRQGSS